MLNATFRPLTQWPGGRQTPASDRRRAPFRAGYPRTLTDLEREIEALSATSVVVQLDLDANQIRNDGWPRSSARPRSPGVVVSFVVKTKPLSFPCDTYLTWEDNLRAISLSLTALRAVDRYGVTRHAEQYTGFAQLPPPETPLPMSMREADEFLRCWGRHEGSGKLTQAEINIAYRTAAGRLHPDKGGSHEQFVKLQQAKTLLEQSC